MYLVDTNVFLEILLAQPKKVACKEFLNTNVDDLSISDCSLHWIGTVLWQNNNVDTFHAFVKDVIPRVEILTLREDKYQAFININKDLDLDFHDTYQYQVAIEHDLVIVTLNRQFEIAEEIRVLIL